MTVSVTQEATAAIALVVVGLAGLLVPRIIRGLSPLHENSVSYHQVAATRGLTGWTVTLAAAAGGSLGAAIGWQWSLLPPLLAVVPCIALAIVDARTHLLPTQIIAPMGLATAVAVTVVAIITGDLGVILRGLGGLVVGAVVFWALWRFTAGMGFGDVRLASVLGMLLAAHSWSGLAIGLYTAFILAALSIPVRRLFSTSKALPFGPILILGTWAALVTDHLF